MQIAKDRAIWYWMASITAGSAALGLIALLCLNIAPPVGVYIAIAGVIGVVVSLRKEPQRSEKAIWLAAIAILVLAEIRGIYLQEAALNRNLKAEFDKFDQITSGLNSTVSKLNGEIAANQTHFDKTISRVDDVIGTETGGSSFCYLKISPMSLYVNGSFQPQDRVDLDVKRVGKYPMHDVSAVVSDESQFGRILDGLRVERVEKARIDDRSKIEGEMRQARNVSRTAIAIGDLGTETKFLGSLPLKIEDGEQFMVTFSSFNSNTWVETVTLRLVDDRWEQAILVDFLPSSHRSGQWTKIDKDFPKKEGRFDVSWPRPSVGRAPWDK